MELEGGADTHAEANTACQTGIKTVVVALNKVVGIAHEGTGVVSHIHIAMTPLSEPIGCITAQHEVHTHILAAKRQVSQQRKLQIAISIESAVGIFHINVAHLQIGDIVLSQHAQTRANAKPTVELIAGDELEVHATVGIPST